MATRRRPTIQLPDPTTVTDAAIDAGMRAVEMTAAIARGLIRSVLAAARAMTEGGAQVAKETTRAASDLARDAGERAKRVAPPARKAPRRALRKPTRRRRAA